MLRTIRYGEADVIAHLFTRDSGRVNVIAKGARRAKSRIGARIEPFLIVTLMVRRGRGELGYVQNVDVIAAHDNVRTSWALQTAAAGALELLTRISEDGIAHEQVYHATHRLLSLLDATPSPDAATTARLVTAWELKLLHLSGLAPQLGVCVRCGTAESLTHFSSRDGGVICASCVESGDRRLDAGVLDAARWLMVTPLVEIATASPAPESDAVRAARAQCVVAVLRDHAGINVAR